MRLGNHLDFNHYAYPLDFCAEIQGLDNVIDVYRLPTGPDGLPASSDEKFDRRKIHGTSEYHPDLQNDRRETLKPYQVVQPEGPSFRTKGHLIEWDKWRFRLGFNYREGMTIHDLHFDNRSLFYRLSLSEMFVPYGDPRKPYPRRAAFDLGNDGAGANANNLKLGCDCLGHIKYFSFWYSTSAGDPFLLPNAVCLHEQDDGILWKHTNYRTGNAIVARSRILVLQTIITVGNYEYIFAFHFDQEGVITYEIRATGILSTLPIAIGDNLPYGISVAPGVFAPTHQHLFSLRIDPAVDGQRNTLAIEENVAISTHDPQVHNPFSVGFSTTKQFVEKEGGFDLDHRTGRTFKILNEHVLNPMSSTPVGYKLVPSYSQMLLADPSSYHAKRSEFAQHAVWVTKYHDGELYASGEFTMQSLGGEGIASVVTQRKDDPKASNVRSDDIVIWHTFGTTHNPRVEDWPVMPSEKMTVMLKPVNFFARNPAIDVQLSSQEVNRSVLVNPVEETNGSGETNRHVNGNANGNANGCH